MILVAGLTVILFGFSAFCFVVAYQNGALEDAGQSAADQPASSSGTVRVLPSGTRPVLLADPRISVNAPSPTAPPPKPSDYQRENGPAALPSERATEPSLTPKG